MSGEDQFRQQLLGRKRKAAPPQQGQTGSPSEKKKTLISSDVTLQGERDAYIKSLESRIKELERQNSAAGLGLAGQGDARQAGMLRNVLTLAAKILEQKSQADLIENPWETLAKNLKKGSLKGKEGSLRASKEDENGIEEVNPNPQKGILSDSIDLLVQVVANFYKAGSPFLEGNFGPVTEETPPTADLKVVFGQIPANLNGTMIRNGPNPMMEPVAQYSWMDGDSMLHAVHFKNGNATYVSRYVQTSRLLQEEYFEKAEFFKFGDLIGEFGLFTAFVHMLRTNHKVLDMSYGWGNGDTGVVYHNGMVMALQDFDKPYVINITENGDLETVGINNYNGKLTHNFTPHPKKDPITGEMFFFGASFESPYAIYSSVDKDGSLRDPVPLTVSGPTYMHDIGMSKNYVIFMDNPYYFDLKNMAVNGTWVFDFDGTKKSRFGVLPRRTTSEEGIKWFEFEKPFFIFHHGNAWEDGNGNIVLITLVMNPSYSEDGTRAFILPHLVYGGRRLTDNVEVTLALPQLYKLTFNMNTGEASEKLLDNAFLEFPKVNESYMGRETRYLYVNEIDKNSKVISIMKYDLQSDPVGKTKLDLATQQMYGSEVCFVPSSTAPFSIAEDDGYLVTFVHHEEDPTDGKIGKSYAYVICAKSMTTVAIVELPKRVPYGFHGIFVTEEELQAQKTYQSVGRDAQMITS